MADKLKIWDVQDDTGKIYKVEGPEDATPDELFDAVGQLYFPNAQAAPEQPEAAVQGPAGPTVEEPVELAPNAMLGNNPDMEVATKAEQEVPGAREALDKMIRSDMPFEQMRETFRTQFKGMDLPEGIAPAAVAAIRADMKTPDGYQYWQNNSTAAPVNRPTGVKDVDAPETLLGEVGTSMQRSAANMANSVTGAVGLAADLVGADDTADSLLNSYIDKQAAIEQEYPTSAGKAVDIRSVGDAARWGSSVLGELIPQVASMAGSGAIAGGISRKVVERGVKDFVEDRIAGGLTREAAEAEAAKLLTKGVMTGRIAGAGANSEVQETGSVYGDTYGATGEKKPWSSLFAGTAAAALDTVLPAKILKGIGGEVAETAMMHSLIKRMGKDAASNFLLEGGTEALQTIIEQLPAGKAINWDEVIEAGLRGAAGGAAAGTATGAYNEARAPARTPTAPEVAPATIVAPTAKRRTKTYKQEISNTQTQISDLINGHVQGWENAPQFEVHQNFNSDNAKDDIFRGIEKNAIGAISDGKVLINAEAVLKEAAKRNVSPDTIVSAVTFHEGLGHHGLDQLFGETLDNKLNDIIESNPIFKKQAEAWIKKNKGYEGDPNQLVRAFEEVLAEKANNGKLTATIANRMANTVKDFGRQMGFDLKYSTREVETILAKSHDQVINGTEKKKKGGLGFRYMVTYHGSGADFDQFDHRKMGTGEGAQVYGWGTYLTDTKDIAEGYKRNLSKGGSLSFTSPTGKKQTLPRYFGPADIEHVLDLDVNNSAEIYPVTYAADEMRRGKTVDDAIAEAYVQYGHYADQASVKKGLDKFRSFKPEYKSEGKLYEVELPDNAEWLHWDFQVDGKVEEAFKKLGVEPVVKPTREQYKAMQDAENDYFDAHALYEQFSDEMKEKYGTKRAFGMEYAMTPEDSEEHKTLLELEDKQHWLGQHYQKLAGELEEASHANTGEGLYKRLSKKLGSDEKASKALAAEGITGVKYLDGNSRSRGEGSSNYVVFDDKTPKIVRKYMMMSSPDKVEMTPEEVANMSPDELFESENALHLLEQMTKGYEPIVMSQDDLEKEAQDRNMPTSRLLRNKGIGAGEIVKRLFMYDIAMEKMNDKTSKLWTKIQSGDYTQADKGAYLQTVFKMQELAARIFEDQGELGRALAVMRSINFTRRRVKGAMETIAQFKNGSPFEMLNDEEAFYKFAQSIQAEMEETNAKLAGNKIKDAAFNALNLPRALMSSMDLSAPLRQGVFLIHKGAWWRSFFNMFRYFGSERAFKDLMADIVNRPTYKKMIEGNLALSNLGSKMNQREEAFMTSWAEKIPVVGRGVRASERAYVGFLNKLRADVFDQLLAKLPNTPEVNESALKDIAAFVNAASGRGNMPKAWNGAAPVLNGLFFSPRLIASRLKMTTVLADPRTYMSMNKVARNEYIKSLLAVGSMALMVTGLFVMGGAEVEKDPRSSDFAKLKFGNTRYDILGGEGQYVTLGARLYTNSYKTTDGAIRKYGTKFGQTNRFDAVTKFATNKAAPIPSFVIEYLRGVNAAGEKFSPDQAVMSRFAPLFAQDVMKMMAEDGFALGAAKSLPGVFGVGVQNYSSDSLNIDKELPAPEEFKMEDLPDGEYDQAGYKYSVKDGTVSLDEHAQKEWGRRVNFYYKEWLKDETAKPEWKKMPDDEKRDVISEIRKDARKEAKADMLELLEVDAIADEDTEQ